jgi:hypothetical protein
MRTILAGLLMAVCLTCAAADDDFKVLRLEQQVLELERKVDDLSRQIADLRQRSASTTPGPATRSSPVPIDTRWLSVANWSRVRPGMSEFEVIDILGPPTTLRGARDAPQRTLMYATEIGSASFLSGNVEMKDGRVVAVNLPTLR